MLAVFLIAVLVAALALVGAMVIGRTSVIHPNMVIGGVDIGGMTVSEAEKALTAAGWEAQGDAEVSVTLPGDYKITVTSEEAGLKTSSREAAESAYAYGHSGNILDDLKAYFRCITGKATAADVLSSANAEGIRAKVDAALTEYDAYLRQGYRVDIEKAKLELVKGGESSVRRLLASPSESELGKQYGQAHQGHAGDIDEDECTSSILTEHIRKTPYIAETDRGAGKHEQRTEGARESFTLFHTPVL